MSTHNACVCLRLSTALLQHRSSLLTKAPWLHALHTANHVTLVYCSKAVSLCKARPWHVPCEQYINPRTCHVRPARVCTSGLSECIMWIYVCVTYRPSVHVCVCMSVSLCVCVCVCVCVCRVCVSHTGPQSGPARMISPSTHSHLSGWRSSTSHR